MKLKTSLVCASTAIFIALSGYGQENATFLDVDIPSTYNSLSESMPNVDSTHIIQSGSAILLLNKASWGGFTGYDVSRATDTITNSWTNDKAAITGSGVGDNQYAIAYLSSNFPTLPEETLESYFKINNSEGTRNITGAYFTNGTWTYRWIQDNMDTLTHLTLVLRGYRNNIQQGDAITVDLYKKTASDTILINNWQYVDMTTFGIADSITMQLKSNHSWTPFYVAMDEIGIDSFNCNNNVNDVVINNVTKSSAEVSIAPTIANSVLLTEYIINNDFTSPPTGSGSTTSSLVYNASSLDSSTLYVVHYRTMCIDSIWSEWRTDSFTTQGDPLSVNNNFKENILSIYPNPATDKLLISGLSQSTFEYYIYNNTGLEIKKGLSNGTINIEELKSGVYFIRIKNENDSSFLIKKFVKK